MSTDPRRPSCRECEQRIPDLDQVVHIYWMDGEDPIEHEDDSFEFETWLCKACAPDWYDCSWDELKEDEAEYNRSETTQ